MSAFCAPTHDEPQTSNFRRDLYTNFERYLHLLRHQLSLLGQRDLTEREVVLMRHLYLHGAHFDSYSVGALTHNERARVILDELSKCNL